MTVKVLYLATLTSPGNDLQNTYWNDLKNYTICVPILKIDCPQISDHSRKAFSSFILNSSLILL